MELTFLCAALAAVSVSFVDGVGYMGVRPPSLKQCCYKDIDKAHFSYDNNLCEGKILDKRKNKMTKSALKIQKVIKIKCHN